ncbi:DUF2972 domain-containing protein [Campylobacter upsaliensis]
MEHFDEVSLWLNSKEFKEKYEDINHPYPPLLNPDKLNDENYILNYEKISANLAWEMNLPLPNKIKMILNWKIGAGSGMLEKLFSKTFSNPINNIWDRTIWSSKGTYINYYQKVVSNFTQVMTICSQMKCENLIKLSYLIDNNIPIVSIIRDPFEILTTWANHKGRSMLWSRKIYLNEKLENIYNDVCFEGAKLDNGKWIYDDALKPSLNLAYRYLEFDLVNYSHLLPFYERKFNMHYYQMDFFKCQNLSENSKKFAKIFSLPYSQKEAHHLSKMPTHSTKQSFVSWFFPVLIDCMDFDIYLSPVVPLVFNEDYKYNKNMCDITSLFHNDIMAKYLIKIFISNDKKESLKTNQNLLNHIANFLTKFFNILEKTLQKHQNSFIQPKEWFNFITDDERLSEDFKNLLIKELIFIKHDISVIDCWQYCKEFLRYFDLSKN